MGICCMTQGTQRGPCNNPEGWDGEANGREFWEEGALGVPMADTC